MRRDGSLHRNTGIRVVRVASVLLLHGLVFSWPARTEAAEPRASQAELVIKCGEYYANEQSLKALIDKAASALQIVGCGFRKI
jgi:hypothetical protein